MGKVVVKRTDVEAKGDDLGESDVEEVAGGKARKEERGSEATQEPGRRVVGWGGVCVGGSFAVQRAEQKRAVQSRAQHNRAEHNKNRAE